MFNKIKYLFITVITLVSVNKVFAASTQELMKPWDNNWVIDNKLTQANGQDWIDQVSKWIVDSIDFLLPITAVGVFLFVGIRLAIAQWNPEEFKKSWMQFMYAVIWIFIVSFAWAAVKLVWGLNL